MTDIGGIVFGKTFGGRKLTKISPNKTISGTIGSFFFAFLCALFFWYFIKKSFFLNLLVISFATSFFSQLGDLFISYIKREAKVKDTGKILPGHGGLLDRIDGILLGFPIGLIILNLFY